MSKMLTLLGFASKAGKLSFGMNAAISSAKANKAKLLIVCSDVSDKSKKEVGFYSEKYKLPLRETNKTIREISAAVGKQCGIISVNDKGFCESILAQEEQWNDQ